MSSDSQTADAEMIPVPARILDELTARLTELLIGHAALERHGATGEEQARQGRLLSELYDHLTGLRPAAAPATAFLVKANGHTFALPTDAVAEIVRVDANPGAGSPATLRRGDADFAAVRLADLWQLCDSGEPAELFALLLTGERRVALLVDRVVGRRHIIAKPLRGCLRTVRGAAAVARHGSGEAVRLRDPHDRLDSPVEHISA
ncbi:MAG: chemotaxis protein CheW [Gemmataceae bacterium]